MQKHALMTSEHSVGTIVAYGVVIMIVEEKHQEARNMTRQTSMLDNVGELGIAVSFLQNITAPPLLGRCIYQVLRPRSKAGDGRGASICGRFFPSHKR